MNAYKKDFSCVGGLQKQIRIIKEVVLFPLMYGEVYSKFNLKPPRGILFYGPPGTGKTLVAGALAGECSNAHRKVSFISRKGSDCLSKWVGESEQNLQEIFNSALQKKPCIIFFDEVDGLAPARSARNDFVHASIVSILLALMDGLKHNSEIIVIGATNRLDAIDPALRRPGRFDRELFFPLPCYSARKDILSIYVKSWKQKPAQKFLAYLAAKTVGYCGSDLQALCTEAVMCCVRRLYPQIYTSKTKFNICDKNLKVERQDFLKAQKNIVPASHRVTISPVKCLSARVRPLLQNNLTNVMSRLQTLCPAGMLTPDVILGRPVLKSSHCPRILLCGIDDCHTKHLGPAILHLLEHLPCYVVDVTTLFEESYRDVEEAVIQIFKGARRTLPSLLYVPDILSWWSIVNETARAVFISLMRNLDRTINLLVFATANIPYDNLPHEIACLFDSRQGEVVEMSNFSDAERIAFYRQLFEQRGRSQSPDNLSRCSSTAFIPKTDRPETNKRKGKTDVSKRPKLEAKRRLKRPNRSRSNHSSSPIETRRIKREYSSGEVAVPAKRRKLSDEMLAKVSSDNSCTNEEIKLLLDRIISISQHWLSCQLESLYDSLEYTLLNTQTDVFSALQSCVTQFHEAERTKFEIKEEHNLYI